MFSKLKLSSAHKTHTDAAKNLIQKHRQISSGTLISKKKLQLVMVRHSKEEFTDHRLTELPLTHAKGSNKTLSTKHIEFSNHHQTDDNVSNQSEEAIAEEIEVLLHTAAADAYSAKERVDGKEIAIEAPLNKPREPISARRSVLSNSDENPYAIFAKAKETRRRQRAEAHGEKESEEESIDMFPTEEDDVYPMGEATFKSIKERYFSLLILHREGGEELGAVRRPFSPPFLQEQL